MKTNIITNSMDNKPIANDKDVVSSGLLSDVESLKALCRELLDGADRCSQKPHYIVQPFLGIVKRHAGTIEKHNLLGR